MANDLNRKFDKDRLEKAKSIVVYDVVELVGTEIDWKYLSIDGSILGATVFCDRILTVFELDNCKFISSFILTKAGTILVDIRVEKDSNIGRKNFTVMYEVFHFLHHKKVLQKRNGVLKKILETEVFRPYEENKKGMTAIEILEWQANYMVASFLVPKFTLINEIKNIKSISLEYTDIKKLADIFLVSYQMIVYRLQSLEILRK